MNPATLNVSKQLMSRQKSKLRANKGSREGNEEGLLPGGLNADIECLSTPLRALEPFRLKIIDWLYPVK